MTPALLIVDDDAAHRCLTARALRKALPERRVIEAASRDDAERMMQEHGGGLCLAIIDLKLDHESGLDVLQALRAVFAPHEVPAIIVSTSDLPGHVAESYAAGANCYVVKGVDPAAYASDLLSAVRYLLRSA